MPLINCKINIILTWSDRYIILTKNYGDQVPKSQMTDTRYMFHL